MQTPSLNLDVLVNVCKFLGEKSDILSVSLTCSSAHAFAVRWLLLTHPVCLKSGPSIVRFRSFLLANLPARAPYLLALHIDLTPPQPQADDADPLARLYPFAFHIPLTRHQPQADDATPLVEILALCNNIEHVTIAFQKASWLTVADPRFLNAINSIPSLSSFTVRGDEYVDVFTLLPGVRAPLRTLCIHSRTSAASQHPVVRLEQSLPRDLIRTLEELKLYAFTVDLHGGIGAQFPVNNHFLPSILDMAQYAAVRSLSVEYLEGRPLLSILQHLFPALGGTLSLGKLGMLRYGGGDELSAIRAENHRSQERSVDGVSPAWKKLDRVICDAPMFFVLGLRCPIRLVMIECVSLRVDGPYAAYALRKNPVPQLKLSTSHHLDPEFGELFSPELGAVLTHLTLCLFYYRNYGIRSCGESGLQIDLGFRWDRILDIIVSSIRPLHKLTHLRIVIGFNVHLREAAPWTRVPEGEYALSFREATFNWEQTAFALSRVLPSLQNIFLTSTGYLSNSPAAEFRSGSRGQPYERWHVTRGWRVQWDSSGTGDVRAENERTLVMLHDDVSETIIRKEELVLSKLDEAALHLN